MLGMIRSPNDDRSYRLALGVLVLAAWLVLALWGASPEGAHLHHDEVASHHGAGEGHPSPVLRLPVFVAGWVVMTIAMMLPGTLPLLNLFHRAIGARADRDLLLALLGAGYIAIWAVFGALAFLGDTWLHALVERAAALEAAAWGIPPAILLAAGLYQFTTLKERCLAECRSPFAFLAGRWHGRRPAWEAWQLGVRHGLFCVGCCWTLMLLMFAVGVAHLGWMLALGAVMSAERAMPWGRRITKPAGVVLAAWGVVQLAARLLG